eukprot:238026-Amphidinium_carterae.5
MPSPHCQSTFLREAMYSTHQAQESTIGSNAQSFHTTAQSILHTLKHMHKAEHEHFTPTCSCPISQCTSSTNGQATRQLFKLKTPQVQTKTEVTSMYVRPMRNKPPISPLMSRQRAGQMCIMTPMNRLMSRPCQTLPSCHMTHTQSKISQTCSPHHLQVNHNMQTMAHMSKILAPTQDAQKWHSTPIHMTTRQETKETSTMKTQERVTTAMFLSESSEAISWVSEAPPRWPHHNMLPCASAAATAPPA